MARWLERAHPELIVSNMKKDLRAGKVLVDWSQNDEHKTTVCVYSLRARERPTVSTPVTWEEVEECWRRQDPALLVFTPDQVLNRVEELGDLFDAVLERKQRLDNIIGRLPEISLADIEVSPESAPEKRGKRRVGSKRVETGSRSKTSKRAGKHAA